MVKNVQQNEKYKEFPGEFSQPCKRVLKNTLKLIQQGK